MKTHNTHWIKSNFCMALTCLSIVISPLAKAGEQAALQEKAKRVEQLFEEGKITERQALAELGHIEAMAIDYRKNQRATVLSAEDIAGTTLMRKAAFPNFSVFGFLLRYIVPALVLVTAIGCAVFFYGSSLGLNRAADWFGRQRRQASQSVRDHLAGSRSRMTPEMPHTPHASQSSLLNPTGSPSHPSPGNRHSGEVPDHLT